MKVVLDTNVLVSGLLNPSGPPAQILGLVLVGKLTVLYDNRVVTEYREVLYRPKFQFKSDTVEPWLELISAEGEYVVAEPSTAPVTDEDDRVFYEVASSGDASWLITENPAHYPQERMVVTPSVFLRNYRNLSSKKA